MKYMSVLLVLALCGCVSSTPPAPEIDTVYLAESALYRNWTEHERYGEVIPAGTKISIPVEIIHAREQPVVRFLYPPDAKWHEGRDMRGYNVCAHLISSGGLENFAAGERFVLDAIIVNRGEVCYMAYFFYVEGMRPLQDATGAPMPDFPEKYKGWE